MPAETRSRVLSGSGIVFRQGQFSFSELVAWEKTLFPKLRMVPGFLSIDADEAQNRVVVRVASQDVNAAIYQVANDLGAASTMLTIEVGQRAQMLHTLSARIRPTSAGYQISNDISQLCTLGWNVHATYVGEGFLTASHCNYGPLGQGGTNGYRHQPTVGNGSQNRLGWVHTNPAWTRTDAECGGITICALADAMFVKYANTPADTGAKRVAYTDVLGQNYGAGSLEAHGWFTNTYGPQDAYVGQTVDKVGRTTGWTRGTVAATCEYQPVYEVGGDTTLVLCAARMTGSRVGGGDSGAPVFWLVQGNWYFHVGILFAGTTGRNGETCTSGCEIWFSSWSNIVSHLGLTLNPMP